MGSERNSLHHESLGEEWAFWPASVSLVFTVLHLPIKLTNAHSHIHWKQAEYFQVERGVIGIHKNGKQLRATKDDGVIEVPAGTR